jgi:hypothetical protein
MTLPGAEWDLPIFSPEPEVGWTIFGFSLRAQLSRNGAAARPAKKSQTNGGLAGSI